MIRRDERWSFMPRSWVDLHRLKAIRIENTETNGVVIAALKLYLALVMLADDKKQEMLWGEGRLAVTFDKLMESLNISRPMVSQAKKLLIEHNAICATKNKPTIYTLEGYSKKSFVKLPKATLYNGKLNSIQIYKLAHFPVRGQAAKNALAIYILFLTVIQRGTNIAYIHYETISERLEMFSNKIRPALDLLISHGFISILRGTDTEIFTTLGLQAPPDDRPAPNLYLIHGLGRGHINRINTLDEVKSTTKQY